MKRIITLLSAVALAGCATSEAYLKSTASGYAEGTFENSNLSAVHSKMLQICSVGGGVIHQVEPNAVTCGIKTTGSREFLARMLVGNGYSTTPEEKVRFVLYQLGPNVNVTAYTWVESQMPNGAVRREELKGAKTVNAIQQVFFALGAK